MNNDEIVRKASSGFENSFYEGDYYNRQTQDDEHLALILNSIDKRSNCSILDLGTGSGYLAFPLAETRPGCRVTGIDITPETIARNSKSAKDQNLDNLRFVTYDGLALPFDDDSFDIVVTRYVLHHFPDISFSFTELSRIIRPDGQLFISDPTPDPSDIERFVDKYMQMRDDGHVKFYSEADFRNLGEETGFRLERNSPTAIRFPRKNAERYKALLDSTSNTLLDTYEIEIVEDEIFITETVNNISFRRV
jgi:ubiquinone/menaquinone biosynthesis C-methylase UbiE